LIGEQGERCTGSGVDAKYIVGQTIRAYRLARGWRQDDLAFWSGVERSRISRIERGVHDPGLQTLVDLAKTLDLHVSKLVKDVPKG
jgi:transcriptional regulator with XRE-family HTH domain